MGNNNSKKNQEIPLWARSGHKKPTTRREFLASGIIPFSAYVMAPQWLNLIASSSAHAQAGCPAPSQFGIPFITINCSGGAGLGSNYVPNTVDGQLLTSYDKVGLGATATLPISLEFGNVPFAGSATPGQEISRILRGMRTAGGAALTNTAFVAACVRSQDDTANNKFALDGMLQRAGLQGSLFPILGTRSTVSGISQMPAVFNPTAPLFVNTTASLASALNYSQVITNNLNANQRLNLARLVQNLSSEQNRKIATDAQGTEVKKLLDCAGVKNVDNLVLANSGSSATLMPANILQIWGNNNQATNQGNIFGTIVYNVLMGHSGSGTLEIGGCDYHDNSRTTGDNKDLEIGTAIGRVLATAAALQKPVFIYVVSDGSVSSAVSNDPTAAWVSDRGESGVAYMLCYKPNGRPVTAGGQGPAFQVGAFTNGQTVDTSANSVVGGDTEKAAASVVANWLSASGQLGLVNQATNGKISTAEVDRVVKFRG